MDASRIEAIHKKADETRAERLQWFQEARFGMFIHWGLYSQLGRHEWAMNHEQIPIDEYEKLADTWKPKPRPMREWAKLAKEAGMKYMVMTTKHHEGFCLWDTKQTDYNAAKRGPGRDLVAEYVDACREYGLKVGFYYSLMDWHHPDGVSCAYDERARRRFLDFTQGCVRELMTNYGKIDILWYDVSWPLRSPEQWESAKMNAMVRELQPHILINNRSQLPEDFGTPEEHIKPEESGRAWEACMTFNGSWGYFPTPAEDWHSVRSVLRMLQQCTSGGGNLLLNVGPKADGSVPELAVERLIPVGKWLKQNGEAVYGRVDRIGGNLRGIALGSWTLKGNTAYFWCMRWPRGDFGIGGIKTKVLNVSLLSTGEPVEFEQTDRRVVIKNQPATSPDEIAQVAVYKMEFAEKPQQELGAGYNLLPEGA